MTEPPPEPAEKFKYIKRTDQECPDCHEALWVVELTPHDGPSYRKFKCKNIQCGYVGAASWLSQL